MKQQYTIKIDSESLPNFFSLTLTSLHLFYLGLGVSWSTKFACLFRKHQWQFQFSIPIGNIDVKI